MCDRIWDFPSQIQCLTKVAHMFAIWFQYHGAVNRQGHVINIIGKPCKQDKDREVWVMTAELVHFFDMRMMPCLKLFKIKGQGYMQHTNIAVKPCKQDSDRMVWDIQTYYTYMN